MTNPVPTIAADLNESASVTLDSNGNGSARLSPFGTRYSGYDWRPVNLYVAVAPVPPAKKPALQATAVAYVSYGVYSQTPNDAIGATATGSTGDTCGMTQTLKPGDWVSVQWTGGDPFALATMRVTGQADLPVPVANT